MPVASSTFPLSTAQPSLPFAQLTRIWTIRRALLACVPSGNSTWIRYRKEASRAIVWGLTQAVDWTVGLLLCWYCWSQAHRCGTAWTAEAWCPLKVGSWPSVFACVHVHLRGRSPFSLRPDWLFWSTSRVRRGVMALHLDIVGIMQDSKTDKPTSTAAANISDCVMFIGTTCARTHLISLDFCPCSAKKVSLQRTSRESSAERRRGNWSPTTPELSDGSRRLHLVIAPFGISFLLVSVWLL